jgi:hypothetical protein
MSAARTGIHDLSVSWPVLFFNSLKLEARVGIGQLLGFQPARLLHSQLSQSQTYRVTGIRTTCENGLFCAFRQVGNYSITTRQRVQENSSEDALLALLLALKSFAKCSANSQRKGYRAGPCVRLTALTSLRQPNARAATVWFTAGPCRFPSRLAETTMRSFRPLLRPAAPTVFSFRLR